MKLTEVMSEMAQPVVTGATIQCTIALPPGTGSFTATNQTAVRIGGKTAATAFDSAPMVNIGSCGMCTSTANPTVASATAAALGVLTPMPCVPSPMGGWLGCSAPLIGGKPALTTDATLTCAYGGTIRIVFSGQTGALF